jgi:hypothetical protein
LRFSQAGLANNARLELISQDQHFRRGFYPDSDSVARDSHDRHHDRIAEFNSLPFAPGQNEHDRTSVL